MWRHPEAMPAAGWAFWRTGGDTSGFVPGGDQLSGRSIQPVTRAPPEPEQLVHSPHGERERRDEGERARSEGSGPEQLLQWREVDQGGGERDLEGDAHSSS